MPIFSQSVADLSPILWGADADGANTVRALVLTLAIGLLVSLFVGQALYRRWSAARLEAYSEAEWVSANVIEDGMSATLSTPTAAGIASAASLVRSVQKRWITLTAPDAMNSALAVGVPVAISIYAESCLYRFHAAVADTRVIDGVRAVIVARPPHIEKVQKREHFRVRAHLPTTLAVVTSGSDENPPLRGVIDNVSGGGFRMAMPIAVPVGAVVRVRVPVVTLMGYSFEARVVRCAEARDFGPLRYRVSCQFIHLPEETRNLIVACCFEIQRELRDSKRKVA